MKNIAIFVLTICFLQNSFASTIQNVKRLYSDLMKDYNQNVYPANDQSQDINILISMGALQLVDLDEISGRFAMAGVLYISWRDESLTWDPNQYNNTLAIEFPKENVWIPPLLLLNPFDQVIDLKEGHDLVTYNSNGSSLWTTIDLFSTSCQIDVTVYPYDTQTCKISFASDNYHSPKMNFISKNEYMRTDLYHEHGIWSLLNTSARVHTIQARHSKMIEFKMTLKRKSLFLTFNIIFPVLVIMVLNLQVFILPVESGERVSYVTTTLLALTVFLTIISDDLPTISDPMPSLCLFIITNLIISVVVCIATIIQLNLYYRDESTAQIPIWIKRLYFIRNSRTSSMEQMNTNEKNEYYSSEDTVKVKIGEKLTWKRVVAFFDRCLFVFFFIISFITTVVFLVAVM